MPTIPADDDSARAIEAVRALARASSLMERASSELSLAHYRVLSAISSGDERASRIAGRLAIGKPTISAAVNAMCERGLLVRMDVEGDLRAVDLRLTLKGRRLLERVEAEMIRRIELVSSKAPDPPAMLESLVQLGRAIEEVFAERAETSRLAGQIEAAE
jgi:DNA-binding MarR family transcriptional regulator